MANYIFVALAGGEVNRKAVVLERIVRSGQSENERGRLKVDAVGK